MTDYLPQQAAPTSISRNPWLFFNKKGSQSLLPQEIRGGIDDNGANAGSDTKAGSAIPKPNSLVLRLAPELRLDQKLALLLERVLKNDLDAKKELLSLIRGNKISPQQLKSLASNLKHAKSLIAQSTLDEIQRVAPGVAAQSSIAKALNSSNSFFASKAPATTFFSPAPTGTSRHHKKDDYEKEHQLENDYHPYRSLTLRPSR